MKQKHIFLVLLIALLIGLGGYIYLLPQNPANGNKQITPQRETKVLAQVGGLEAGDQITYEMTTQNGSFQKQAIVDQKGFAELEAPENMQNADTLNLDLDIRRNDKETIRFSLAQNQENIKVSGYGLNRFSDIEINRGQEEYVQTKSDWTGAFEITNRKEEIPSNDDTYKVALHGHQILDDTVEKNPLVIEVLATDGGGGPTDEKFNQYQHEGCGKPKLSSCLSDLGKHTNNITNRYPAALIQMSNEFVAVMMKYVQIFGQFLDAKTQLETQADFQRLQAQAHKDYHPSEQMCRFGSFVKSVATVEESAKYNKLVFNKIMMDRYTNTNRIGDTIDQIKENIGSDFRSRLKQFREVYCDPKDLNNGLENMCQHKWEKKPRVKNNELVGGQKPTRFNNDIDYTRMIDTPLTIDVNFTDSLLTKTGTDPNPPDPELIIESVEEDVIALAKNLYWPEALGSVNPNDLEKKFADYTEVRHLATLYNIAHNSFANIVGMKSEYTPSSSIQSAPDETGPSFMKAFMKDFGLSDQEIDTILGQNPSYYAQMEVLTKKMYQDPDFYTNLYDKPANVKRINASMEAIKLMQMRDWFESNLRREMLTSVLLEKGLEPRITKSGESLGSLEAKR